MLEVCQLLSKPKLNLRMKVSLPNKDSIIMERAGDFIAFSDVWFRGAYDVFKVKPGFIVIDVGAHIGTYTIKAARSVGSKGRVIAIEPHPANFRTLLQNIMLNKLNNVTPVRVALSSRKGYVKLYLSSSSGGHSIVYQAGNQYMEVPSLTLDGLLNTLGVDHVDLIKIDVEGAEMDVLKGARQTLEKTEKIVVATYHYASEPREVAEYVTKSGFKVKEVTRDYTLLDSIYGTGNLTHWLKKDVKFLMKCVILRTFLLVLRDLPYIIHQAPCRLAHGQRVRKTLSELTYAFKRAS